MIFSLISNYIIVGALESIYQLKYEILKGLTQQALKG